MESSLASQLPIVDNNCSYSKYERLVLALSHYHADLTRHLETSTFPKPVVLQLAKIYGISEPTLRRHIKNPGQKTRKDIDIDKQLLTPGEEQVLVRRLLFLDDFNIPASREQVYELAHAILRQREPDRIIGKDWFYRFLDRHEECRYLLVKSICTSRANAVSWDMMDDFFAKVSLNLNKKLIISEY
jgi:hypothetical protein